MVEYKSSGWTKWVIGGSFAFTLLLFTLTQNSFSNEAKEQKKYDEKQDKKTEKNEELFHKLDKKVDRILYLLEQ